MESNNFGWSTDEAGCVIRFTGQEGLKNKSVLTNCIIELRKDQKGPMFTSCEDEVSFNLDGYAIVPVEKYRDMKRKLENTLWYRVKKILGLIQEVAHIKIELKEAFVFPNMRKKIG